MRKKEILKFEAKNFWRGQFRGQANFWGQAKIWGQANFEAKNEANCEARPGQWGQVRPGQVLEYAAGYK